MSFQHHIPGLDDPAQDSITDQPELPFAPQQPATEKQIHYAQVLALKTREPLPRGITTDRAALSKWIEAHKAPAHEGRFANYPSSKQVQFAERIARVKHRDVPQECFHDRTLMSRWIDSNKPR